MARTKPPSHKGRRFPIEILTVSEVHGLLKAASPTSPSGIRARAIIAVLFGAGLRVGELLHLYPRDLDTQRGVIRIRGGKGGKTWTVGIDPGSCALVDQWLDVRAFRGINGHHPVFCGYRVGALGQELSDRYVRTLLTRLGHRAGIEKRVHPHGLRHSLAYDLAQRGVPMPVIQAQLGHGSLATTDRYVRHLMPSDVVQAMRQHTW